VLSLAWNDGFNVEISLRKISKGKLACLSLRKNFRKKFYTESHHYEDLLYVVSFNILVGSSGFLSCYRLYGMTVSWGVG
jgi:hypothetical protein